MIAILQKLNFFAIFVLGAFLCPCQSHEHLPAIAVNHLSLFTVVHLFYIQAQQVHVILWDFLVNWQLVPVVVLVWWSFRALTQRHFLLLALLLHFLSGDCRVLWQLLALLKAWATVHHVSVYWRFGLGKIPEMVNAVLWGRDDHDGLALLVRRRVPFLHRRGRLTVLLRVVITGSQHNIHNLITNGILGREFGQRLKPIFSDRRGTSLGQFRDIVGVRSLQVGGFGSVDVKLFFFDGFVDVVQVLLVVFFVSGHWLFEGRTGF
jgi:hypothetical protein